MTASNFRCLRAANYEPQPTTYYPLPTLSPTPYASLFSGDFILNTHDSILALLNVTIKPLPLSILTVAGRGIAFVAAYYFAVSLFRCFVHYNNSSATKGNLEQKQCIEERISETANQQHFNGSGAQSIVHLTVAGWGQVLAFASGVLILASTAVRRTPYAVRNAPGADSDGGKTVREVVWEIIEAKPGIGYSALERELLHRKATFRRKELPALYRTARKEIEDRRWNELIEKKATEASGDVSAGGALRDGGRKKPGAAKLPDESSSQEWLLGPEYRWIEKTAVPYKKFVKLIGILSLSNPIIRGDINISSIKVSIQYYVQGDQHSFILNSADTGRQLACLSYTLPMPGCSTYISGLKVDEFFRGEDGIFNELLGQGRAPGLAVIKNIGQDRS